MHNKYKNNYASPTRIASILKTLINPQLKPPLTYLPPKSLNRPRNRQCKSHSYPTFFVDPRRDGSIRPQRTSGGNLIITTPARTSQRTKRGGEQ